MASSIEYFDIVFDSPNGVFYAGQKVSGSVVLTLKSETKINEVLLELKGCAKTYWTKHGGKSRKHYSDNEPYFCDQFNTAYTHAFGAPSSERILPAGRHQIPFSMKLPSNLPSSFEGQFGHVRFTCTATLEVPLSLDVVCRRAFSVVGLEDLNDNKDAWEPVHLDDQDFEVRSCCTQRGLITLSLSLAKRGFVPGESLRFNATVANNTDRSLKNSTVRLRQHISYKAKEFSGHEAVKQETFEIAKKQRGAIAPGAKEIWANDDIPIPSVPPKLARCKTIDVSYTLELDVDPGVNLTTPVIIGNVPLMASIDEMQTSLNASGESPGSQPSANGQSHSPVEPEFEEGICGKVDIREGKNERINHGEHSFCPRYPFYKSLTKPPEGHAI